MEIIVKHPTNPLIVFSIQIDNSTASTTTIEQVLRHIEEAFITCNGANRAIDYVKHWKLRNIKTGVVLSNNATCSTINPGDNEFSVVFCPE